MAAARGEGKEQGVSREEALGIFSLFDADGSGTIDHSELRELAFAMGVTLGQDKLEEAFAVLDTDKSGAIDFEEFYAWITTSAEGEDASTMLQLEMQARLAGRAALSIARSVMDQPSGGKASTIKLAVAADSGPAPAGAAEGLGAKVSIVHGSDGLAALEARDDEPAAVALILNLVQGTDMDVALDWVTNMNGLLDSLMATHAPPQAKDVLSRVAVSVRQSSLGGPPQLVFGAYLRTDPVAMALEQAQASGSAPPGAQELADIFGEHGLEMLSRFCVEANLGTSAAAGLGIEESPVEHGGMHAGLSLELSRSALMGVAKALTALSSALPPSIRRLLPMPMRDIVSVFKAALALRKVDVDFDVPLDFTQQLFKMLTRRSTALPPGIVGKLYGEWETKTRSAEYMQKRFCSMMPGMAFHAMME
ncbi:CML19, partial [Symbiodinium sp. KB8]